MKDIVDHEGEALFGENFEHITSIYEDFDGPKDIDIIKTDGNMWFSATQAMDMMGMSAKETKNTGRVSDRIDHPDIIKIKDTPLRFTDGRRNRGSLISPRALMVFLDGKTRGFNFIKAIAFVDWVKECVLEGKDEASWSPSKQEITPLVPVFRKNAFEADDDEALSGPLGKDPLASKGPYLRGLEPLPLQPDEIEFCISGHYYECPSKAACWCKGQGGLRTHAQQQRDEQNKMLRSMSYEDFDPIFDDGDIITLTAT